MTRPPPLVSVIVAAHDAEQYVALALESVLRQTFSDLELIFVDDASGDRTPDLVSTIRDGRLRVFRNEAQLGLASSLNSALGEARGRYVARLDADDVAMPRRLERQLARITSVPKVAIVGTAAMEIDDAGRPGRLHLMPPGSVNIRWAALFSSPFFHPSVLVDRDLLADADLRYDVEFLESEDYELWARVLARADGANLTEPLVLYRVHPGQASQSRRDLQRSFQIRVALREIGRIAPDLPVDRAELAWRLAVGEELPSTRYEDAFASYLELLDRFEQRFGGRAVGVRAAAAQTLLRATRRAPRDARVGVTGVTQALRLDPAVAVHTASLRFRRRRLAQSTRRDAKDMLAARLVTSTLAPPIRVTAVFPEPTPYRSPLLDRVAALPEIDLNVIYAAETVARRTWQVEPRHRAVFLRGLRVPGAAKVFRHDYPITPGVVGALTHAAPAVVVVSGWSTFAAQAAIAWCGIKRVPYVLLVESHDEGPRAGWRRTVKGTVVPPVVQNASGVLVTGTLARNSMILRGAPPERVRVFANTVDVEAFGEHADRLSPRRDELRLAVGALRNDVVVVSVARLGPEKRLDDLVRAVVAADDARLLLVLAGDGSERGRLEQLAGELKARVTFSGETEWERIVELYIAADVFALLSERETWAVVVNEAAACGLPLVLSDRVGAAHDLLRDGENGALIPAGDVHAAASALRGLAADPELRRAQGRRSRELARDWGYGPSVEGFLAAVREAVAHRG